MPLLPPARHLHDCLRPVFMLVPLLARKLALLLEASFAVCKIICTIACDQSACHSCYLIHSLHDCLRSVCMTALLPARAQHGFELQVAMAAGVPAAGRVSQGSTAAEAACCQGQGQGGRHHSATSNRRTSSSASRGCKKGAQPAVHAVHQ